ncbi:uncharacterized protein CDAR_82901 [Caerostris darwini]|uniref:Uncharacterized protein n=1 Tax=Caerostris darwini TaxID=1538125 RepID=A0AAV4NW04_9ARAC|nr:uncharacterized protein CDAR_82901 [Caerostris darwini]
MKQATLFSLKKWKNTTIEDIQKYKCILDNKDVTEEGILKALISLKKENPRKNILLTTGIDAILTDLKKHPSSRVSSEAYNLSNYWRLNKNTSNQNVVDITQESPIKKCESFENDTKPFDQQIKSLRTTEPCILPITCLKQLNSDLRATQSVKRIHRISTKSKHVFKKKHTNGTINIKIIQDLHKAIKLFATELGEQEVELYLEKNIF